MTTTAVNLSRSVPKDKIVARLSKRFGPLEKPVEIAVFDFADKGLIAGSVMTNDIAQLGRMIAANQRGVSANGSKELASIIRRINASVSTDAAAFQLRNRLSGTIPFDNLPLMEDLFGDNPEAARALVVTHQSAVKGGKPARLDIQLAGGETWEDFIERAISWRDFVADYDPYRFDDMDEQEIIELSIQVVAGWRKW